MFPDDDNQHDEIWNLRKSFKLTLLIFIILGTISRQIKIYIENKKDKNLVKIIKTESNNRLNNQSHNLPLLSPFKTMLVFFFFILHFFLFLLFKNLAISKKLDIVVNVVFFSNTITSFYGGILFPIAFVIWNPKLRSHISCML